jgi:hypothetical protein
VDTEEDYERAATLWDTLYGQENRTGPESIPACFSGSAIIAAVRNTIRRNQPPFGQHFPAVENPETS